MSFDKDYYEKLEDYYKDMLKSMNNTKSKCQNCDNIQKFIIQRDDSRLSLIHTCGSDTGDCGPQYEITLPVYIDYFKEYKYLYEKINNKY